jgi:hypothetical protein
MMDLILIDRIRREVQFRAFERARLDYEFKHASGRDQLSDRKARLMEMIRLEMKSKVRVDRLLGQMKAGFDPDQPRDAWGRWVETGRGETLNDDDLNFSNSFSEFPTQMLAMDINGFTKHGLNQAISRGVSPSAILDALNNPISIRLMPNGTTRYTGASATVVVNPFGSVVTVWPQ